ncbi:hypothetical protein LSAT2_000174 [Lamellibrachia satsuma]|nr:hypothetical protein LSAT2_000174 [Lamellibrachia satsuma]
MAQSVYIGKAFASTVVIRHGEKKRFVSNVRAMPRRRLPGLRTCLTDNSLVLGTTLKRTHGMTGKLQEGLVSRFPKIGEGRLEVKLDNTRTSLNIVMSIHVFIRTNVSSHSWRSATLLPDSVRSPNTSDRSTARTTTFKYRVGSADDISQVTQMDTLTQKRLSLSSAATSAANDVIKVGH